VTFCNLLHFSVEGLVRGLDHFYVGFKPSLPPLLCAEPGPSSSPLWSNLKSGIHSVHYFVSSLTQIVVVGINHCDVIDIGSVYALCRSLISSVLDRHDDQIEIWRLSTNKKIKDKNCHPSLIPPGTTAPLFYCYTHCRISLSFLMFSPIRLADNRDWIKFHMIHWMFFHCNLLSTRMPTFLFFYPAE